MRHQRWSEPLPHHADEPARDRAPEPDHPRSSGRARPFAMSALALIAAALIVVILAAAL
jgi:hypothetical protein